MIKSFALKIEHFLKFGERVNNSYHYRFAAHPRFAYWAYKMLYRKIILSNGNLYIKQNPADLDFTLKYSITLKMLLDQTITGIGPDKN